ncbi:sulfatase family protein [Tichowtungia aerotolerans]|uniref:Sulfatase-like hydrolase/transferase n=1 Tax=Tichowtungia aerotolerans TaxID=2697043 RepID=A0A6P1M136_9BACT|nr:sulfatase [Tichowtungia aerotolerans]QHI68280.1 sulfatase-like hydrolase/transferase [Tichowtungia aerotolerans]
MKKVFSALSVICLSLYVSAASRPNILLITTDDQGLQVGCYGDELARTPNLDRLAEQGVRFTQAYIAQASCSSSRSAILTGLYPHQNGQFGLTNDYEMHPGIETLPAMLKKEGYHTGIIGKLHVRPESAFPFDFWEIKSAKDTRHVRNVNRSTQHFLDSVGSKPFFLMVNLFDPHRPYDAESNQCDGLPEKPLGPDDIKPFEFMGVDTPELRAEVAAYYNCVARLDTGIGLLMETLEQRGLSDNTLVVFLGDHGVPFTRAKVSCYEAGEQVPFIVRWPKGRSGSVCDRLISSVDIVPTIAELVDFKPRTELSGQSLVPLLEGKEPPWRQFVCAEYTAHRKEHFYPRRSIRNTRYKLVHNLLHERINPLTGIGPVRAVSETGAVKNGSSWNVLNPEFYQSGRFYGGSSEQIRAAYAAYRDAPEYELYDLEKDPFERVNLVGNPEVAQVFETLKTNLENWQAETDDSFADSKYLATFTAKTDALCK